jgi:hypothetical protein
MKSQRSLPAIAAVAVLMLTLTACGGNTPAEAPGEPSATVSPSPVANTAAPAPSPTATAEAQVIQGTGSYVGQIDSHSIEIETEEGPTAFELGAGTESVLEGLEMEDPVVFEYVEKPVEGDPSVVQRILSKLSKAEEGAAPVTKLPETRTMKLTLEGMAEEKTATLADGEGYSLYVFDIFTFDAASNRLSMKVDPDYYAEIEKLPSDFNLDLLEQEGRKELSATGKVTALSKEERDLRMSDLRLYLTATGLGLTRQTIVKEIDGQGYMIKLNIPQREASEGFGPHVYASLDSIISR